MIPSPLRVAIVGAGPAGFYAAAALLKADAEVDLFDRLPTPHGLVRAGVAPDHPKLKNVTKQYAKTAALDGFRFFGNVGLGEHITRSDLLARYHALIYSIGTGADRRMGIEGEDLLGSHSATEFVAWYNGHPDYCDCEFDLSARRVAVIGNGNVAIDVARMLALSHDELAVTDTADHALECFEGSAVEEILILGRRGPAQASFTNPELREMGELADADVAVTEGQAELDEASARWLAEQGSITNRKNVEIFTDYAGRTPEGKRRRVEFRFLRSPVAIRGHGRVEAIELERNQLVADGDRLRASGTGETETVEVGLVFRSIGYRGLEIEGLPFDERAGVVPNERGRISEHPREYVSGWIKRGPSGVIGTNKKDANETVAALFEDAQAGRLPDPEDPDPESVERLLAERQPDHVTLEGWQAIDAAERAAGEPHGRPRVKLTTVEELVAASRSVARAGRD